MAPPTAPDWSEALARARAHAPFLARSLDRQAPLAELLEAGEVEAALDWGRERGRHENADTGLRRHRLALATTVAIADLADAFPLARVLAELTDFADHALDTAIRTAIEERTGEARTDGFIALALGKQGAGELNYSSDIDPILLYDPAHLPRRESDDPGEAAQRYARRIVKLLSQNMPEGYVLRVDLRLRPASEISPLAVQRSSALAHYQSDALAWERAAFIRARAAAGDIAAGKDFLAEIAPFVWRTALDYGAVGEIRELTRRIRAENEGPDQPGPGYDIKRGRGGIREIEFFAQTHQLIHGGRDPALRLRGTRPALDALAAAGRISTDHARTLGANYDRLRTIEHRLQMIDDRQTHVLPECEALDAVARLDGMADGAALVGELEELTAHNGAIYEGLIGDPPDRTRISEPVQLSDDAKRLARLGYDDPEDLAARIAAWSDGRYASVRSPQAREALGRLVPLLLKALGESDDPRRALTRWERVLSQASSAVTLFRLCAARPEVLERLVAALTLAPTLANELGRQPERLDVLIDLDPSRSLPGRDTIIARMRAAAQRDDYEARLDAIRRVTGEERFALAMRLIEGSHPPRDIAQALSEIAEAAIVLALEIAQEEFAAAHGSIPGSELVVLGLGRLGGGALTHASDLDMIYLFTGDFAAQSDGERPLGATLYYNRLASRVSAALSVPTGEGAMYEIDTRLRPQGKQGPLAVSLDSFANYQAHTAWTWEHMALSRARVLAGSDAAREAVGEVIAKVLWRARDPAGLEREVLAMRRRMARHKPPRDELDVKRLRGGLVDAEFIVQCLQLREGRRLASDNPAALDPDLAVAIPALEEEWLIAPGLHESYDLLTSVLVAARLLASDNQRPPPAAAQALARACSRRQYDRLIDDIAAASETVAERWRDLFGEHILGEHQETRR